MADPIALTVSALALAIAATTAWLTLFRRGTVKMTQPTGIYFGPDRPRPHDDGPLPKVFLRTLLFSTSKRGRVIENIYVSLSRNETHQNFNIWVYGEKAKLERGSGLFVGETGVVANHHFLTPRDANSFRFIAGQYKVEVFANLLGSRKPKLLFSHTLEVTNDIATQLAEPHCGLYFDWGPDARRYIPHIDKRAAEPPDDVLIPLGLKPDNRAGRA